ncbi:MAG TPA: molybdenum ABC transporter ATP-binding protein [Rhodocyclaceae bacterium]|nr:molybdenum ABC transporter ATP-binding protein [Rhodocyclaceae bacterium]
MIRADFAIKHPDFELQTQLEFPAHGVTALFGPSGSGKSTLLRCLAGLTRPDHGRLIVNDKIWQDDRLNIFVPPHQRPVGMVFQDAALFPHLNVEKNLAYGARRSQRTASGIDGLIELLGIGHLLKRHTDTLSGGEKQRVAIARALYSAPELLLLDEPLAALDAARKAELLPYLETLHQQLDIPIVYVSHAPAEVARLADHIVLLHDGKIGKTGAATDIFPHLEMSQKDEESAFTLLLGRVHAHDDTDHLTQIDLGTQLLWVRKIEKPVGAAIRLRVLARDISLALQPTTDTSILNTIPAQIESLEANDPGRMLVKLKVGETTLFSRITIRSAKALNLSIGQSIYAQIKGVAPLE